MNAAKLHLVWCVFHLSLSQNISQPTYHWIFEDLAVDGKSDGLLGFLHGPDAFEGESCVQPHCWILDRRLIMLIDREFLSR